MGVVEPLTPVTVVVASFCVVGVTDLTALSVVGVPRPVRAVTLSPLAAALVIPVTREITPVPALAPVASPIVG